MLKLFIMLLYDYESTLLPQLFSSQTATRASLQQGWPAQATKKLQLGIGVT